MLIKISKFVITLERYTFKGLQFQVQEVTIKIININRLKNVSYIN